MTLRTLNYGNYGIFLIMGNAGFCPSTVARVVMTRERRIEEEEGGALSSWQLKNKVDPTS